MCKEIKMLLLISGIFTLAMGLSGIFINTFFFRETNSFIVVVIYNLMQYISTPITFIGAGWLAKRKNGIWSLRIGLTIFALFFSLMLLIGSKGIFYIYLLGVIFGIGSGFYWLAFHTLSFDYTTINNRDTFNGYNGGCASIAGAIAPISAGFLISHFQGFKGYYIVFGATLSLFVLLILISMFLKCENYGRKLTYKAIFKANSFDWSNIRIATALWGFKDVVIVFIINILIIKTTGSEMSLGEFALIAALISSGAFILVQKLIKPKKRIISIFLGSIFSFTGIFGLFMGISYWTLLLYTIMSAFFLPFYIIQLSSATFNVIDKSHKEELRVEYIINKELALNCGRVISTLILLIFLTTFNNPRTLNYFLVFIGAAPILSSFFLAKLKDVLQGT